MAGVRKIPSNKTLRNRDYSVELKDNGELTATQIEGEAFADDEAQILYPYLLRWSWEHTDPDGVNDDIIIYNANSPAISILDVWEDNTTAEGGAMTLTLRDAVAAGGNAITNALDINTVNIERTTLIANNTLAAGSALVMNFSGNPGTAVGVLYILCVNND